MIESHVLVFFLTMAQTNEYFLTLQQKCTLYIIILLKTETSNEPQYFRRFISVIWQVIFHQVISIFSQLITITQWHIKAMANLCEWQIAIIHNRTNTSGKMFRLAVTTVRCIWKQRLSQKCLSLFANICPTQN